MRDLKAASVVLGLVCATVSGSALAQQPMPPVTQPAPPPDAAQPTDPNAPPDEAPQPDAADKTDETGEEAGEGGGQPGDEPTGEPPPPEPPIPSPPAEPPPPAPQPPYPNTQPPPYGGYQQPGYGPPPGQGYAYGPPPGPPRPIEKPPRACCAWSIRYDPFDLIFRRVTLEGEIAWGDLPLSLELAPSYIFDHTSGDFDARGVEVGARVAWYVQGHPLEGFWLKAHFSFEHMKATLFNIVRDGPEPKEERVAGTANPDLCDADSQPGTCKGTVNSVVLGFMLGNSTVIPDSGGFALTGGIGIGAAVTNKRQLEVIGTEEYPGAFATFNEGFVGRLRLLGSLSLGVTF